MRFSVTACVAILLVLWTVPLSGARAKKTTVYAILEQPSLFSGKIVQVKGTVNSKFENISLAELGCGPIWIDLADDHDVRPAPKFKLRRDANFVKFEHLMETNSTAEVTLVGRLDGVNRVEESSYARNVREHEDGTTSGVVGWKHGVSGSLGRRKRVQQKQKEDYLTPAGLLMEGGYTHPPRAAPCF